MYADLTGSVLSGAKLDRVIRDNASMFATDLRGASLVGASMVKSDLRGACLRGARLVGASLIDADLRESNLEERGERDQDLPWLEFEPAGTECQPADRTGADLSRARSPGETSATATSAD